MARNAITIAAVIVALSAIVWGIRLRLSNPDMTDVRLGMEYPGQVIGIFVLLLVSVLAFKLVDET